MLTWRVLRALGLRGEQDRITLDEFLGFVMRCSTHDDTEICVDSLIRARRRTAINIASPRTARRNAQDWIRFLLHVPFFAGNSGRDALVGISEYGATHAEAIDEICELLQLATTFWIPKTLNRDDRLSWYASFGTIDVGTPLSSKLGETTEESEQDTFAIKGEDEDLLLHDFSGDLRLRDFDPRSFMSLNRQVGNLAGTTIETAYDAGLAKKAHRLHDQMVVMIGNICRSKQARVQHDPWSVDLLVEKSGLEYIVEVKSVTPRNFVSRLRYAIGQICQYDYARSLASSASRRKVIAVAAHVPETAWYVPFLNNHLDFDLLSLEGNTVRIHSNSEVARGLFTPN